MQWRGDTRQQKDQSIKLPTYKIGDKVGKTKASKKTLSRSNQTYKGQGKNDSKDRILKYSQVFYQNIRKERN